MGRNRRRRGGQSFSSKAGMGASDAQIMTGNIADAQATKLTDQQQYWLVYKKHPWVRACIKIIGNALAADTYDLAPVDDSKPLKDGDPNVANLHDFLRTCFVGRFNTFRKFKRAIGIDQQIYAVAYARKKYGAKDGEKALVGIERMNPLGITPVLNDDKTAVDHYTVKRIMSQSPGSAVEQIAAQMTPADPRSLLQIPADEMIVFALDDGGDDILPSPPVIECLDLSVATDLNVRQHRRKFFSNGTTLGNVLMSESANEDQVRDAQRKLSAMTGGTESFRNIAIAGKWTVGSLLASGGRDFDFIKGSELTLEEICAAFGVPPSKLRDISGSMGQAGKGEDDATFEEECILPIEESFYETLTSELLEGEFGVDYFSIVPARRNRVRLERFDAAVKLVKFGGSGNQALDLVGLPKVDDPEMDKPLFIGATGQNGVSDDEIDQPPPQDPSDPQGGNGEGDVPDGDETQGTKEDEQHQRGVGKTAAKGKAKRRPWY